MRFYKSYSGTKIHKSANCRALSESFGYGAVDSETGLIEDLEVCEICE